MVQNSDLPVALVYTFLCRYDGLLLPALYGAVCIRVYVTTCAAVFFSQPASSGTSDAETSPTASTAGIDQIGEESRGGAGIYQMPLFLDAAS